MAKRSSPRNSEKAAGGGEGRSPAVLRTAAAGRGRAREPEADSPELYALICSPVTRCSDAEHAKGKKNCANNPWCVWGLGEHKEGLWKETPSFVVKTLGDDPSAQVRQELGSLKTPVGLKNLGATCYLNVLVQALHHNRVIRNEVFKTVVPTPALTAVDHVVQELQKTFASLLHSNRSDYNLEKFVALLKLNTDEQQDPMEFNGLFLNKCFEDGHPLSQLLTGKERFDSTCANCNNTVVGNATSVRQFDVGIEGLSTLDDALSRYFDAEEMTGECKCYCEKCGSKQDATRQCHIVETSPVLFIGLRRYIYDFKLRDKKKLKTPISFPDVIQFPPNDPNAENYRLVSVLYHKGASAHGGHYIADVLDWDQQDTWWRCDDDKVTLSSNPSTSSSSSSSSKAQKKEPPTIVVDDEDGVEFVASSGSNNGSGKTKSKNSSEGPVKKAADGKKAKGSKPSSSNANALDPYRDAYMLAYVRETGKNGCEATEPQGSLVDYVREANIKFDMERETFAKGKRDIMTCVNVRREQYEALNLQPADPTSYHLLPSAWLKHWITGEPVSASASASAFVSAATSSDVATNEESSSVPMTIDLTSSQNEVPSSSSSGEGSASFSSSSVDGTEFQPYSSTGKIFNPPMSLDSFYLNACEHGKGIPATLLSSFKVVSDDAFKAIMDSVISSHGTDVPEDRRISRFNSTNYRCTDCIEALVGVHSNWKKQSGSVQRILHKIENDQQLRDELKPFILSKKWIKELKSKGDVKNDPTAAPSLPKKKSKVTNEKATVESFDLHSVNSDLLCEHHRRAIATTARATIERISNDTWECIVKEYSPENLAMPIQFNDEFCQKCSLASSDTKKEMSKIANDRKQEIKMPGLKMLIDDARIAPTYFFERNSATPTLNRTEKRLYDEPHYLVENKWLESWRTYVAHGTQKPGPLTNRELKCDCGAGALVPIELVKFCAHEELEPVHTVLENNSLPKATIVTREQWQSLKIAYSTQSDEDMDVVEEVVFAVKLGSKNGTLEWDPASCTKCVDAKQKAFEDDNKEWTNDNSFFNVKILAPGESVPGEPSTVAVGAIAATAVPRRSRQRKNVEITGVSCSRNETVGHLKLVIFERMMQEIANHNTQPGSLVSSSVPLSLSG